MSDKGWIALQMLFINRDFIPYLIDEEQYDEDMVKSFTDHVTNSINGGNHITQHMTTFDKEYFYEVVKSFEYVK